MAGTPEHRTTSEGEEETYLSRLRDTAQAHLEEIELDKEAENEQMAKTDQDLKRYSKVGKKQRTKSQTVSASPPEEKGPRFRSAQDVLDRLRWDPSIKLEEYHVGYLERFEGIKEMPASAWIREFTDEDWIPQHRIKYVRRINPQLGDEIVWDREARIDKIFGSGHGFTEESVDGSIAGGMAL